MTRIRAVSLAALAAVSFAVTVRTAPAQQPGDLDRVFYYNRAKDKIDNSVGEVKESAAGVQITGSDKKLKLTVSPADMIRIEYQNLKGVDRDAYLQAGTFEAGPDAAKALAALNDLVLKAGPAAEARTKRALISRQLLASDRVASDKRNADFAAAAKETEAKYAELVKAAEDGYAAAAAPLAEKLAEFARLNAKGWECWPTGRAACRLFVELRKPAEAATLARELGDNADLAADLRVDARVSEIGYLLMAGGKGAAASLADLRKGEAGMTDRQKEKVAILAAVLALPEPDAISADLPQEEADAARAASAKKLRDAVPKAEEAIGKAKDPTARAVGYNALGETYWKHGLYRDAQWSFLWVDVVYSQDKDEHMKALTRLVQYFQANKEEEREKQFRARLPRTR